MTRVPNQSVQPTGGSRFAQRGFWRQTVDWSGLRVLRDSGLVKRKGRSLPPHSPRHTARRAPTLRDIGRRPRPFRRKGSTSGEERRKRRRP